MVLCARFASFSTVLVLGGLVSFASFGFGCSGGRAPASDELDAAVPKPAETPVERAESTLAVLRAQPVFASALRARSEFRIEAGQPVFPDARLRVKAPTKANGALRLEARGDDDAWIEVRALDASDVAATLRDGVLTYPASVGGGDLVFVGSATSLEEARVLREPVAEYHARYSIRLGARIVSVRAREHRIECVDANGYVVIGTAPLYALDAKGVRRELDVAVTMSNSGEATVDVSGSFAELSAPIVVDPVWSTVSPMSVARLGHAGIALKDGTILVTGGQSAGVFFTSSEVYDPKTNTWTTVGSMNRARGGNSLALTPSGKVMIASSYVYDMPVESYDPATKTWSPVTVGSGVGVGDHVFTFSTGKIAMVGGESISLYDETTAKWTLGTSGPAPRGSAGIGLLADGRLMFAGGLDFPGKWYSQVDIYDPKTDSWTTTGPLSAHRTDAAVIGLADGGALAVGGNVAGVSGVTIVERYDVVAKTWSIVAPLPASTASIGGTPTLTMLAGGRVMIPELGYGGKGAAIFDPAANEWRSTTPSTSSHGSSPPLIVSGTAVYVIGGNDDKGAAGADVEKFVPMANGSACVATAPGDCVSGFCTDGVCCNRSCTGPCERCDASGSAGTCSGLTGAPHATRTCDPYAACSAGSCASSCTVDGDCTATSWCSSGKCAPRVGSGKACTSGRGCNSGNCVDGVCCDTACSGQCEACNVGGKEGVCTPVTGTPKGARPACTDGSSECGAVCNGTKRDACVYLAAGSRPCGKASCLTGVETHPSTCDGKGACSDKPSSCGNYACGVDICKSACGTKADCTPGNLCVSNACVPAPGLGDPCKDAIECSTGYCVDGVCCGVPSCGAGSTCAAPSKAGHCTHDLGLACSVDDQCASGKCVDGVCCESACNGNCEACDVPGNNGHCTAVKGAPRGARPACASDTKNVCAQMLCDGVDHTACKSYVAAAVTCHPRACTDGTLVEAVACDGKGACPATAPKSCGGYACDPKGQECLRICHSAAECTAGYVCDKGECRVATAACSIDGASAVAADGTVTSCESYRCRGDHCLTTCTASDDCAAGKTCGADGTCSDVAPSDGGGGCSVGAGPSALPSRGGPLAALFGLLAMGGVFLRRRRAIASAAVATLGCVACSSPTISTEGKESNGSNESHTSSAQPAKTPVIAMTPTRPEGVIDALGAIAPIGGRLHGSGTLVSSSHGLRLAEVTKPSGWTPVGGDRLLATLPSSADANLHLEIVGAHGMAVDLRAEDVGSVAPTLVGNVAVYRNVDEETDLVHLADVHGAEELRLLRVARDRTFTYRLHLGAGAASARVIGDHLEILDENGIARLRTAPLVAWDARGETRSLHVELAPDADGYRMTIHLDATGLTAPIAVDPAWSSTADTHWGHAPGIAVRTTKGTVFAFDAVSGDHRDLYDPTTSTWKDVDDGMLYQRHNSGFAVPLASGKILIGGGFDSATARVSELWDPTTGAYTLGGSQAFSRANVGTAFVPAPYNVSLVIGGNNSATCDPNVYRYDEATSKYVAVASMSIGRVAFTTVVLSTGKVLVVGGAAGTVSDLVATGEIYDPATNTWKASAPMSVARSAHSAIRLTSGKVLVVGNSHYGSGDGTTAEIYDPTTDKWTSLPKMAFARETPVLALLPSGRVLIAGGNDATTTTEVFDPATNTFVLAGAMADARAEPAGTALADGSVLVFGGNKKSEVLFSAERFVEQATGNACTGDGDCTSGHCADGVCCATTCTGACSSCGLAASKGTCSPTTGAPLPGHGSCAPYLVCVAGACGSTCTADTECTTGNYCNSGKCVPKKTNGLACAAARECGSAACADGVCCNVACDGQCEACAETGTVGTCTAVSGLPRTTHVACDGITIGGACGSHCNGVERKTCVYPAAAASPCSGDSCGGGIETHASSCDGVGRCNDAPKHCGAYACGGTKCKTACAVSSDCVLGFVCKGVVCVPAPSLGQPCSSTVPCDGGLFCTDGVCCGEASCGSSKSCALPATKGTCAKVNAEACVSDGECGSGACVDGVCCSSTCDGQCQACDEPGNVGKCVPVKGKPHGKRIACESSKDHPCESTVCDGSDGSRCVAFVGSEVSCAASTCVDGVVSDPATCVAGACSTPVTHSCAPYRCTSTGACGLTCAKSEECAAGFVCNLADKKCVASKRRCSDDGASVLDPEGSSFTCAPFLCRADDCLVECKGADDCAPGLVCDGTAHCSLPRTETGTDGGSGGCSTSGNGTSGTNGRGTGNTGTLVFTMVTAGLALAGLRRRRR